jgi:hypothetical protein
MMEQTKTKKDKQKALSKYLSWLRKKQKQGSEIVLISKHTHTHYTHTTTLKPVTTAKELAIEAPESSISPQWPTKVSETSRRRKLRRFPRIRGPAKEATIFTSFQLINCCRWAMMLLEDGSLLEAMEDLPWEWGLPLQGNRNSCALLPLLRLPRVCGGGDGGDGDGDGGSMSLPVA